MQHRHQHDHHLQSQGWSGKNQEFDCNHAGEYHQDDYLGHSAGSRFPHLRCQWQTKRLPLRRANGGGFEKAKALLLEAAKLFPEDGMIHYNLACYCAQLGQLDAAQEYLDKSYELGDAKKIKLMALDDEDLKPLWESESK